MYEDPQDLFREMDEMFSRLFTRMDRGFAGGNPQVSGYYFVASGGDDYPDMQEEPGLPDRAAAGPVAEVHRIGAEVKVIVELPGAPAESIRLDVHDGKLVIDAEGCMNPFHTIADLPPVNAASMYSSFRNGVLEVTFGALPENPEPTHTGAN